MRITLLLVASIFFFGCASQNDEQILRTMEELKREMTNMRQLNAKDPTQLSSENTEWKATQNSKPSLRTIPGLDEANNLPIVRLTPENHRYRGDTPIAKALQRKNDTRRKANNPNRDIFLPQDEVPDLVYQTLDRYGNRYGGANEPIAIAVPDSPPMYPMNEERDEEPEITAQSYNTLEPITSFEPDISDGLSTMEENSNPSVEAETPTLSPSIGSQTNTPEPSVYSAMYMEELANPDMVLNPVDPAAHGDPELLYQWGMDALRTNQYDDAMVAFRALLDRHEEHDLADNALYWIGETYYDQSKYALALSTFQDVLKQYPLGNKVPDAMVKVGLCFHNLGKMGHAQEVLKKVISIYPTSNAANVAQSRLATM